jgi:hypothetical protein
MPIIKARGALGLGALVVERSQPTNTKESKQHQNEYENNNRLDDRAQI